ncbi:MAG TPA: hypothetical protein PLV13_07150, partial [Ilumatobacteraceae bacterium]|nr:hypothetical protein [Ilumatobacteraceae bacterium]
TPLLVGAAIAAAALVVGAVVVLGGDDNNTSAPGTTGASSTAATSAATSAATGPATSAAPAEPREVSVPVGEATVTATECVDTTGLLARSTAVDVDGGVVAAIADGNLYVLSVDSDCVISQSVDEVNGLVRDGDVDFTSVTILNDLLIVGSSTGGLVVDRRSGSDADCDLLREIVNRTPEGEIATYDSGGSGYDVIRATADGCTMVEAGKFPEFSFFAVASGPNAIFLGAAEGGTPAVYARLRNGKTLWTYDDGSLVSIDGMSTCGDYLCVLDATSGTLTLLVPSRGQVVGTIDTTELASGDPQRLNSAGDGYLTVGQSGASTTLLRLAAN